ncbi:hypothetical protein LJC29_03350 [Bacteroides sp. OttesenSCG-928-N06]|nr:hypothetical protein [Bacteroides sp. OttesenSCG-928-N06]
MVKIRIMKVVMILVLFCVAVSCTKTREENSIIKNIEDLGTLIELGYDHINDSLFFQICEVLNDSLLGNSNVITTYGNSIRMFGVSSINEIDSTVGWYFVKTDYEVGMLDGDIFYCDMSIGKGRKLNIKTTPREPADIQKMISKYVFHPDTTYKQYTYRNTYIPNIGDLELANISLMLDVHVTKSGFSINDWYFFFDCLNEVIKACENERNLISLKIWGKDYRSLSFSEKETLADVTGYPIILTFNFE